MSYIKNKKYILIVSLTIAIAVAFLATSKVYAKDNCEENYGGGETCLINKRFKIEKWVRKENEHKDDSCNEWDDEVTMDLTDKDERDHYVEFCVKITNKSDKVENLDFDGMKMLDNLPDELTRIGGDGLSEYWDNFKPGESKTFKIRADIKDDEKNKHGEFKKCAVNKAEVFWKKEFEGSATATVCWKKYKKEIKELPHTGTDSAFVGLAGLTLTMVGVAIKKIKGAK
jgi:hypothetical protein